jgi:protein-tyrosine phosphatase
VTTSGPDHSATAAQLRAAADCIEAALSHGEVLVCCALGYSRSATAVAAWLMISGRAADSDAAIALVCARRRGVVFSAEHRQALAALSAAAGNQADTSVTIR